MPTILIVDDSRLLDEAPRPRIPALSLVHAHDGLEALQCLRSRTDIDAVLLDIDMPRLNALELLQKIKSDPSGENTAVVVVGAARQEQQLRRYLEAGASAYIKKPFGNRELLEVIQGL